MLAQRPLLAFFTAASILVTGCKDAGDSKPMMNQPESAETLLKSTEDLISMIPFGDSRTSIEALLGPAASVEMRLVENPHVEGTQDTVYTLVYPGYQAEVYALASGGDLVSSITITDTKHFKHPRLRLGMTQPEVLAALGEPEARLEDSWMYDAFVDSEGADQPVYFYFQDGVLDRIVFDFYMG